MVTLTFEQEERAKKLHAHALVIDGHSDYPLEIIRFRNQGETKVLETRHLPHLLQGGVDLEVLTVGCDSISNTPLEALNVLDALHQELQESDKFQLITSYDDITRAKNAGKIGLLLALEGVNALQEDLFLLRTYYRLGLRQVGLTWNQRNLVADGCGEPNAGGLSNFGRRLIEEINKMDMILDLSHSSERSFMDAIELIKTPPVASHSNTRAICDFPRNLSDAQIEALADRGGVMGLCFYGSFVMKNSPGASPPTPKDLMRHVDHIVNLVGIDHISLGPDYIDYTKDRLIAEMDRLKARGVDIPSLDYVQGLETVSTLGNITRALVAHGYDDEDIEKILGGNLLRVYNKILR